MEYTDRISSQNQFLRNKTNPIKSRVKRITNYVLGFSAFLTVLNVGEASLTLGDLHGGITEREIRTLENEFYEQTNSNIEREISKLFHTIIIPGREFAYWRYNNTKNDN